MTYDVGDPSPGLGQEQTCGKIKPVTAWDPNPVILISRPQTAIHKYMFPLSTKRLSVSHKYTTITIQMAAD